LKHIPDGDVGVSVAEAAVACIAQSNQKINRLSFIDSGDAYIRI
jgi:hypothetical protein